MAERLKDRFFNRDFYDDLNAAITSTYPTFDSAAFIQQIYCEGWQDRPLMAWMRHTTQVLGGLLPTDYRAALAILLQAAPQMAAYEYENLIFSDFVATYGLTDWEASLPALERFTQIASAEFAVRPFITQDQPRMMAQMLTWATHPHAQVRRLASEGCRPLLPWGMVLRGLKADPAPILPILEQLKADPAETVRRSVANNLNDIAKNQPEQVLAVTGRWAVSQDAGTQWIIRHALRTLIKRGHPQALALVGYPLGGVFALHDLTVTPQALHMGEELTLSFVLESSSHAPQNLMVDYIMYFMRANGQHNAKVFKLMKAVLPAQEQLTVSKRHSFRPISTRRYYAGPHAIEVQVNGVVCGRVDFVLKA